MNMRLKIMTAIPFTWNSFFTHLAVVLFRLTFLNIGAVDNF